MTLSQPDILAVFTEALARQSDEERSAYLDEACGADHVARKRVDALLRAHFDAGNFLRGGSPDAIPTQNYPPTEYSFDTIGPYKLLQQIGEGGMGTVYMAEQTHPVQRQVALKLIKPGCDSRQVIARFEAERQALALMDHPSIAKVLDAGTTESGQPYFVMELVHGVPITKYCDEHRLPPRQRLELFVPICHAIQHAHQKGVIHRDIKPTNVLIAQYDGQPVPKVIDFGVAKATGAKLTERTMFTEFGAIVGTLEYMSPEQAERSQHDIDTRSDIYSLGVLLYELLTGTTPLERKRIKSAAMLELLRAIKEEEPPRPSMRLSTIEELPSVAANRNLEPKKLSGLVRGELDWIVMKALEKDRNRRYETANGFAMDVQRYLADEQVTACPPSAAYRFRKFARRNKAALATGTLISGVLVATVVILAVSNVLVTRERNEKVQALGEKQAALTQSQVNFVEAKRQEGLAQTAAEEARKQQGIAQDQEKLARRRFYAAQMNLASQAWKEGHPARALQLLESQRPRFDEDDLRGFDWYYLWRLCQGNRRFSIPALSVDNASAIAISPDGATLATVYCTSVRLWDLPKGRQIGELPGGVTIVTGLAFSPDGKTLAATDGSETVKLWDLTTRAPRATVNAGQGVDRIQFTEDGRTLIVSGKHIKLWDVATNREFATIGDSGTKVAYAAGSPAGDVVAATGYNVVRVWIREGDAWRELPPVKVEGWYPPVAISPDSTLLAVGVNLYDLPTCQLRRSLEGHTGPVYAIAFTKDGRRLASGGLDRTVRTWDVETGREETCLAQPGPVYGFAITPDGATVAAKGSDAIHVWDVASPPSASILSHQTHVDTVAFSPDGEVLACLGLREIKLWDVAQERVLVTLPTPTRTGGEWFRGLAFSPDGQSLAVSNGDAIDVWTVLGQRLVELACQATVTQVAYLPSGKSIAAVSRTGAVEVWDLPSKQRRYATPHGNCGESVAVSPDGKLFAAGYQYGGVKLFDADTGRELSILQRNELAIDWTYCLAFSPDSRKLASGNQIGLVRIWDVVTNRLDVTLVGHTDAVRSLAFLDGGRTLASGSVDRTIRLWDVETGQEQVALTGHESLVNGLDYSEKEGILASACHHGNVRLWRAAVDERARAPRLELDSGGDKSPVGENEFGDRSWQAGRPDEAEAAYRRALTRLEKLHADRPDNIGYCNEIIRSLLSLSLLSRLERSDAAAAETLRRRAIEFYQQLAPQEQRALFFVFSERQRHLWGSGAMAQADRAWSHMLECLPQDDPYWLARAAHQLAISSADPRLRDTSRALQFAERAVALPPKSNLDKTELAGALACLARVLENDGRRAEAEAYYRRAIALFQELTDEDPGNEWYRQERAYFSFWLANLLRADGRAEEALEFCRSSVQLLEQLTVDFPAKAQHAERLQQSRELLKALLTALGRHDEAADKVLKNESKSDVPKAKQTEKTTVP